MTNVIELLFDGLLAVLLCVTIAYCGRLSGRIRMLQDGRSELAAMIAQFDQATGRATTSMTELQSVSKRLTDALQLKIDKANFLADDLAFLIEKSTKIATQLETLAKTAKTETPAAAKPKSVAESLAYLETPPSPPVSKPKFITYPPAPPAASSSVTSAASLEALLSRLAASPAPATSAKPATTPSQMPQAPRTGAERELLAALKSGR